MCYELHGQKKLNSLTLITFAQLAVCEKPSTLLNCSDLLVNSLAMSLLFWLLSVRCDSFNIMLTDTETISNNNDCLLVVDNADVDAVAVIKSMHDIIT